MGFDLSASFLDRLGWASRRHICRVTIRIAEWKARNRGATREAVMAYDADAADTVEWGGREPKDREPRDREPRDRGRAHHDRQRPDGVDDLLPGQAQLTEVVDPARPERGRLLRGLNPYALGCALG